jgi:hypothetical protein
MKYRKHIMRMIILIPAGEVIFQCCTRLAEWIAAA